MKIMMIGFGTVGQGFAELLLEKKNELPEKIEIVAVYDKKMGGVVDPNGIDLKSLLEAASSGQIYSLQGGIKEVDVPNFIKEVPSDVMVEVTYTNLETGEPAYTHIIEALKSGKNVVTTNKGPIALFYNELKSLADKYNRILKFEGTVLSGTPAINLAFSSLKGSKINKIRGILNGTTNYILTNMQTGMSYSEALKEAQKLGYAEADPTGDVEGWDAMAKILILTNVLLGGGITKKDVFREGITGITADMVKEAIMEGKKWKLIGEAKVMGNRIEASVKPQKISKEDKLYSVDGVLNSIVFTTDTLGEVQIVGPGAGRRETGYAVLSDILSLS